MRTYRAPRELLAQVREILARKPSPRHAPLLDIITLLCQDRNYSRISVYLADSPQQLLAAGGAPRARHSPMEIRSEWLVELKIAGRVIGILEVQSERENAFSGDDRVFLESVASLLAAFLTGPGKYLVRRARQSSRQAVPVRGPKSVLSGKESKTAAVGE